jgi:hypothetical protein
MSEMLEVIGLVTIVWLGIILIIGLCFWVKDFILEHRLAYNKGYKDGLYGYYGCIGCVYPNSSLCDKCKRNYEDMYTVIKDESNSC